MKLDYRAADLERKNMIYLMEIGQDTLNHAEIILEHRNDAYLFLMVDQGSVILQYFEESFLITERKAVLLDMCTDYLIKGNGCETKLLWICFSGSNLNPIYEDLLERKKGPCFRISDCCVYQMIAGNLAQLAVSHEENKGLKIYQKLLKLLVQLVSEEPDLLITPRRFKVAGHSALLNEVTDYLDKHYMEHIRLDELAARFFIDKYYITKIFRERYKITIFQYLKNVRLSHVCRMLENTDMPVGAIARACGYEDPCYFFKVFKKEMHMTASDYRSLHQEKLQERTG